MKQDHYQKQTQTQDLNVRHEAINFLKENMDSNLLDIGLSDVFVALTPKTRETKVKINRTTSN